MTTNYTPDQLSHWESTIKNADSRLVEHAGGMTEKSSIFIMKMIEEKYHCKCMKMNLDFGVRIAEFEVVSLRDISEDLIFHENLKGYLKLDGWEIKVKRVG